MKSIFTICSICAMAFLGCADFKEPYENVIAEKKIRPFGIRVTPAEALPGDTVQVDLLLWDAGKDYQVQWRLGLDYSIANYGTGESVRTMLDLDSMALDVEPGSLSLRFVVPKGAQNPMLLSPMIPDQIETPEGLYSRSELVHLVDSLQSIPNEMGTMVDQLASLLYIDAKITSGDFKLTVQKLLTVRYSKKLEEGERISSVNENPRIDSLGLIVVDAEDVEDPEKIDRYESDTLWFKAQHGIAWDSLPVESISVSRKKSYFWISAAQPAQRYLSPSEQEHSELQQYQWFYTNLDDVGESWGDQIEFTFYSGNDASNIACMKLPSDQDMKEFAIHVVLRDNRPEWQLLNSAGIDFVQFHGKFD